MISRDVLQKEFKIFIFVFLLILLVEIAGGILTNSLALLSDAEYVLIDLLALLLAYFSIWLSRKSPTKKFTFGYYRAEILAAVVNGVVLVFVTLFIFYQSYIRFLSPQPIKGMEMFVFSTIGLLANLYVVIKMRGFERHNLNVRGVYLHVLSDTLSSIGVVIVSILIIATGRYIFDPIISVMIVLFILLGSVRLIRESAHILMEAAPRHIDIEKLSKDIQKIKGVKEVHDLRIWSISSDVYALNSHILIDARNIRLMNKIVSKINKMLKSKYNITHTVIQSECENCVNGEKDNY